MASDIKVQPIGKRVLIQPEEIEDKTPGGLVIPPSANDERPALGTVLTLGKGTDLKGNPFKFDVKVGDKVFFGKYSPTELELNGETYLLLKAEDILAVLK